jgi:hypothetical protein
LGHYVPEQRTLLKISFLLASVTLLNPAERLLGRKRGWEKTGSRKPPRKNAQANAIVWNGEFFGQPYPNPSFVEE